uniref:Uncharacterized protein n=1 Tax=Rhizophora mucronata TaxID=61149 RepID=A0A2P2NBG6_RHIMU
MQKLCEIGILVALLCLLCLHILGKSPNPSLWILTTPLLLTNGFWCSNVGFFNMGQYLLCEKKTPFVAVAWK